MTGIDQKMLMQQIAMWARAKGIVRPTTREGWQALIGQFLQAHQPAIWTEIGDPKQPVLLDNGATIEISDGPSNPAGDDFDDMVEKRERAMVAGGGDDLAREAILQDAAHNVLQGAANFVRTAPPSATPGTLGGSVVCQPGGQPVQVANWVGETDVEAMPVSILLNSIAYQTYVGINPLPVKQTTRPYASIQFGVGINQTTVEVDIGAGTQLVVPASSVGVSVAMDKIPSGQLGSAGMMLGASLAFNPIPRGTAPLTRTRYVDNLAAQATQNVVVPPFAKRVYWFSTGNTVSTAPVSLVFQDAQFYSVGLGGGIYQIDLAGDSKLTDAVLTPILVGPDIVVISVENTMAAGNLSGRLVFELSL